MLNEFHDLEMGFLSRLLLKITHQWPIWWGTFVLRVVNEQIEQFDLQCALRRLLPSTASKTIHSVFPSSERSWKMQAGWSWSSDWITINEWSIKIHGKSHSFSLLQSPSLRIYSSTIPGVSRVSLPLAERLSRLFFLSFFFCRLIEHPQLCCYRWSQFERKEFF